MKNISKVTIEDLSAFFRDVSNVWVGRATTKIKKKAIEDNVGKFALIRIKDYAPGSYLFGQIEDLKDDYFSINRPLAKMKFNYEDVQELIVENR